jgi:hypothetical protein
MSLTVHADDAFDVRLAPAARDALIKTKIGGRGTAHVTLRGKTLTISGTFEGMPGAASRAELRRGAAVGVRGPAIAELTASAATNGTLAGEIALDDAGLEAFNAGQLYIQIASELAPEGSVWGWLLPAVAPVIRDR